MQGKQGDLDNHSKKTSAEAVSTGESPGKRKRPASEIYECEVKDTKPVRGRPRVDTIDATDEDRRRTQVRLAQRAYRSRKEMANERLKKNFRVLAKGVDDMKLTWSTLYNYADYVGIMQAFPDFGCKLQSAMLQMASLPSLADEVDGRVDVGGGRDGLPPSPDDWSPDSAGWTPVKDNNSAGGHESQDPRFDWFRDGTIGFEKLVSSRKPVSPTFPTAGFPVPATMTSATLPAYPHFLPCPPRVGTDLLPASEAHWSHGPWSVPSPVPPVQTYSGHEMTFVWRLHRGTCEIALQVVKAGPGDPRFLSVLSFVANVPLDEIMQRVEECLVLGPLNARGKEFGIHMAGAVGKYLYSEEVEIYFARRGLHFAPGVDHVVGELDLALFETGQEISKRRFVSVDVNALIENLVSASCWLGFSPGIKVTAVQAAFWQASRVVRS